MTPLVEPTKNILIVDDNPANLRLLSDILRERGYHARAVTSGPRALASADMNPPDLILMDIRMPGMDGYEVCQQLKANPKTADIPVIFISALDEISDKVKAFEVGGVDYMTKPFQLEEVIARVETHLSLRHLRQNLEEANRRMERELALAAQVQVSFLPKKHLELPGWQMGVALLPARETSGDFFDTIRLPNGLVGLLIADVVDKGVGAALFMAMSCALLRTTLLEHIHNPAQVFHAVNQRLLEYTSINQFVTVFLGVLNPTSGQMAYCNAGQNPPLLFSKAGTIPPETLIHTGPPIGILEDAVWEQGTVQVNPGDVLVLYTDGITEAENPEFGFYGSKRLIDVARNNLGLSAEEIKVGILDAVREFTRGDPLGDDIALMVVRRLST